MDVPIVMDKDSQLNHDNEFFRNLKIMSTKHVLCFPRKNE